MRKTLLAWTKPSPFPDAGNSTDVMHAYNSMDICLRRVPPETLKQLSDSPSRKEVHEVSRLMSKATLSIANLIKSNNDPACFDVFLSHYKVQAGIEARLLKDKIKAFSNLQLNAFLDSDDLIGLDELSMLVNLSKNFVLIMSPHNPKDANDGTTAKFGPFGRKYCLIEIISWYLVKAFVPSFVVVLNKNSLSPAMFPSSPTQVKSLLSENDWSEVAGAVGLEDSHAQDFVLKASRALAAQRAFSWAPTTSDSEKQLSDLLCAIFGKASALDFSESRLAATQPSCKRLRRAGLRTFVISAQDVQQEARYIAGCTEQNFQGEIEISLSTPGKIDHDAIKDSPFVIVLLSEQILSCSSCLAEIAEAVKERCVLIPVEISRLGLAPFNYNVDPDSGDPMILAAFAKMKKTMGKKFDCLASADVIQSSLTNIWGSCGFESTRALRDVPMCRNVYETPVELCAEFVPGTREWVFDAISEGFVSTRDKSGRAFVVVGSAGMGKSALISEFSRRHSLQLDARVRRLNPEVVTPTTNERDRIIVAALHFFNFTDENLCRAETCVGSIARQLASNVEGYRSELERAKMDGLDLKDLGALFRTIILEPAKKWRSRLNDGDFDHSVDPNVKHTSFLIVIDAFDECRNSGKFASLILKFWSEMPSNFGLVITTRPSKLGLDRIFKSLVLEEFEDKNKLDMSAYLSSRLASKATARLVSILKESSGGMFLYAKFACEQLLEKKSASEEELLMAAQELPEGMFGIYVRYFSRLVEDNFSMDLYSSVLAPILASRVPLPEEIWKEIIIKKSFPRGDGSQSSKIKLNKKFDSNVKFHFLKLLNFSNGTVAVLHKSMDDFLRESAEAKTIGLSVNVELGHESIAEYFVSNFEYSRRSWEALNGSREFFCARHGLYHLIQSGSEKHVNAAVESVLDIDNVMRLVWASSVEGSVDSLVTDIQGLLTNFLNTNSPSSLSKVRFMRDVLELGGNALIRDPRQLVGQILGRLMIPALDSEGGVVIPPCGLEEYFINRCDDWLKRARGEDGQLRIATPVNIGLSGLRPAGGALKKQIRHESEIASIAVGNDGQVFVGCRLGNVDIRSFSGKLIRSIRAHSQDVYAIAVSHDSRNFFTASNDKSVCMWDAQSGEKIRSFAVDEITYAIAISSKPDRLVVGTDNGNVKIFETETGALLQSMWLPASIYAIAISSDSKFVFTGSTDKVVRQWDVEAQTVVKDFVVGSIIFAVKLSPDLKFLFTGGEDRVGRVFDVETGVLLREFKGHTGKIRTIAFSSIFGVFYTGSQDNTSCAWDFRTGKLLQTFEGHSGWVAAMAISADSRFLFTGAEDQSVGVWDLNTDRKSTVDFRAHSKAVRVIAVSSDQRTIVTGSVDCTARAWDLRTGKTKLVFEGHSNPVRALALSEDSKMLFTGSPDLLCFCWSLSSGKRLQKFDHGEFAVVDEDEITALAVSRDSKTLFSSTKASIEMWDVSTGIRLRRLAQVGLPALSRLEVSLDSLVLLSEKGSWRISGGLFGEIGGLCTKSETLQEEVYVGCAENAVGFTQDDPSTSRRFGDLFISARGNLFECWCLR